MGEKAVPDQATLQMIARLVDETSGPLKNISRAFADFKRGADPEKTTSQFKGLSGAIGSVGSQINQVAAPALASLGIRAGISAASIVGLTKVAADYARTVSDLRGSAQIMNMTTAATIQWDRSIRAVGISGGAKAMEGMSTELLKIKDNVAGVHEELNQWDPSGNLYAKLFPHALRGDVEGAVKEIIKQIEDLQKAGEFGRAEIMAQRFLPGGTAKQWVEAQQLKKEQPQPGPDEIAQAEKLNETMQKFWTTWDRFYSQTMTNLIPGVDKMMQGMTAGFEKMPEYADRFLNSPAGKLLAAMVPKEETSKFDKEGNLRPPPELPPELSDPAAEREAQKQRNAAGGAIPSLFRAGTELGDLLRYGKVQRRTETQPIVFHPEKLFQGPATNEVGGAGDPFSSEAWSSYRDTALAPSIKPPAPAPVEPGERRPYSSIIGDKPPWSLGALWSKDSQRPYSSIIGDRPPWAAASLPATPRVAAPVPLPTETPASGDDVKEGAKQGIKEGLLELLQRAPKATDEAFKRMSLTEPSADGKRSLEAAANMMWPTDQQKPIQRAVETFASAEPKPELQQDSKAGDLGRRLQQSAIDLQQISLRQSPSDAMRQLQDRASVDQRREDQTLRDRFLMQPQLMPAVDQITAALANQKIEGEARLKVDIAAPPGTRTAVSVAGLFNETEINRRRAFQMEKTAFNDGFELG
jgi:hypothetical protein